MSKIEHIKLSEISKTKKIYIEHTSMHHNESPRSYDCVAISYISHSSGVFKVDGKVISVSEGDIFITNPKVPLDFEPDSDLHRIDIYMCLFQPEAIRPLWNRLKELYPSYLGFFDNSSIKYLQAVDSKQLEIRHMFIQMIDEYMNRSVGYFELCHGYLNVMLIVTMRKLKTRDFKRVFSNNITVDECIKFINHKLYSGVSLKDIAAKVHKSPQYISRLFKKHTNMTTSQFINFLRIEKAKDLLRNTDMQIYTIHEVLGCGSEYIRRLFKADTSMTMKEYRAKYRQ